MLSLGQIYLQTSQICIFNFRMNIMIQQELRDICVPHNFNQFDHGSPGPFKSLPLVTRDLNSG